MELQGKISGITAKPPKEASDEPIAILTLTFEAFVSPDVVGDAASYFGKTVVVNVDLLQKELLSVKAKARGMEPAELFR